MLRNQNLIDGESNFLLDQQQGQRFRSTQSNAVKELIAQHLTVHNDSWRQKVCHHYEIFTDSKYS